MDNLKKKFSQTYDKNIDKIYRFVFLKVNSQEVAEDLTSEIFVRGWEAYQKSQNPQKKEIENMSAFLYKIARNLITDHYRQKGKAQIISTEDARIIDPRMNLEEKAVLSSDINAVRLALAGLKDDYQDVIIWYYLEEFSVAEIGKMLDKSEGAVRVMIHRALNNLKNELG